MFMLEDLAVNKTYKKLDRYPIKTFQTHMEQNVKDAIWYYYWKYNIFIQTVEKNCHKKLIMDVLAIPSFKELLEQVMKTHQLNTANIWNDIMTNKKNMKTRLINMAKECNNLTNSEKLSSNALVRIDFLLKKLKSQNIQTASLKSAFPSTISLNTILADLSVISDPKSSDSSYIGARTDLLGRIYETGISNLSKDALGSILSVMQTGDLNARLPNNTIGQIKSDAFLSMKSLNFNLNQGITTHLDKDTGEVIELEESALINVENDADLRRLLNKQFNGERAGMLGLNIKSWTNRGAGGSLGKFSISAQEINNRSSGNISERFSSADAFRAYNGYVVSKYLINIIGAYNGLMVTGYQFEPTYFWLQNLYNQDLLIGHKRHGYATSLSGKDGGKKYLVGSDLSILKQASLVVSK